MKICDCRPSTSCTEAKIEEKAFPNINETLLQKYFIREVIKRFTENSYTNEAEN
jgi:hypothetical protein